jgi:drug/metabolite transporter (DMT)-like permease
MERKIKRLSFLSELLIYISVALYIGLLILVIPIPLIFHWTDLLFSEWWIFVIFLVCVGIFSAGYYTESEIIPALNDELEAQKQEEQPVTEAASDLPI